MNSDIVRRIFGSLQALERCLGTVKSELSLVQKPCEDLRALLPQQEAVLRKMRRYANLLQLYLAANDIPNAVRMMKLFYGLNHMVRTDIMEAHGRLAAKGAPVNVRAAVEAKAVH